MEPDPWSPTSPKSRLPGPVQTIRITLFVLAGFTALVVIGGLLAFDITPEFLGALLWAALPGLVGLAVALRLPRGGTRLLFWLVITIAAVSLLGALGSLGDGSPRGLTQLVVPVVLLTAATRPAARNYFSGDPADDAYTY